MSSRTPISASVGQLENALRLMAPTWVRTGARPVVDGDEATLWPGERIAISRAVASRRAEFSTGRALLRELIGADVEIAIGPDRRPRFPTGIVGTLAHDRNIAVAATTARRTCRALGIDIEPTTPLDEEMARVICRPEERHEDPHLVFVLKEAAYKSWSTLGGRLLEHWEVSVAIDPSDQTFRALIIPAATAVTGRYAVVIDRYVALVVVDS